MARLTPRIVVVAFVALGLSACSSSPAVTLSSAPTNTATAAIVPSAVPTTVPSPTPAASTWPAAASLPKAGRILFVIERDGVLTQPAYIDSTGFHLIPITPEITFGGAIWAPQNTIIFDSERAGLRHLFRMGIDGSNVVQLTSGNTGQDSAALSPDGSTLAFGDVSPSLNRDIGIHLVKIDGSNVRDLTPGSGPGVDGEDGAAFSPDGKWIAFGRVVNPATGLAGLFIIRTDGTGLRRLTADALRAAEPHWSPDGKRILFISGASGVWILDVATGKTKQLSDPGDSGTFTDANWSPDGTQIVYRHFTPGTPATLELVIADADGSHPVNLWVGPIGFGPNRPDWQATN